MGMKGGSHGHEGGVHGHEGGVHGHEGGSIGMKCGVDGHLRGGVDGALPGSISKSPFQSALRMHTTPLLAAGVGAEEQGGSTCAGIWVRTS